MNTNKNRKLGDSHAAHGTKMCEVHSQWCDSWSTAESQIHKMMVSTRLKDQKSEN